MCRTRKPWPIKTAAQDAAADSREAARGAKDTGAAAPH